LRLLNRHNRIALERFLQDLVCPSDRKAMQFLARHHCDFERIRLKCALFDECLHGFRMEVADDASVASPRKAPQHGRSTSANMIADVVSAVGGTKNVSAWFEEKS
jgi:hypothetical protein